jgi:hypothetical protein
MIADYREQLRDKHNKYLNNYYQINKEKLLNYKTEKFICECGCEIQQKNDILNPKNM